MALVRTFVGTFLANVVFYNKSVTSFLAGTVVGIYVGQNYDVPNVEANVRRAVAYLQELHDKYRRQP
ncbi:hypothetical protein CLOM_g8879 [Closterium sp. NIES-68]|nr:hypothetical protein CLOM_g15088 [Closterium sp. NIES-68]GJP34785.1 hypothetical protein CLOM_g19213 [Closterium sp. NIES-68]GJP49697.1 hypothetical protein CLOM_g8879 [Closterium sp. NIES-68]GJP72734.1 hypothetical protein CLOP_g3486 [Closterium sp. NIES-67]